MNILLTGASGFIGKAILKAARQRSLKIFPVYRELGLLDDNSDSIIVSDFSNETAWRKVLPGINTIIHAAASTPDLKGNKRDRHTIFQDVNVNGTLILARQAVLAGVKRFIFISSIKVNGEVTNKGYPFTAYDYPAPVDDYGISKMEAETQLMQLANDTGLEVTIIRPPLVYGPGVKGNLALFIKFVKLGLPLPFGDITDNRRSFVGIDNLVDLILLCSHHSEAANEIFLVSDGEDLSTSELIIKMNLVIGKSARLVCVPKRIVSLIAYLFSTSSVSRRLLGSLQVDIQKTCDMLDWEPSVSVDECLRRTFK